MYVRLAAPSIATSGQNIPLRELCSDLREREITNWVSQSVRVIKALHGRPTNLVHRDLKRANIMVDQEGNWVVSDFPE